MILHRMTARFGPLEGETLTLREGMNLIYAPNGGGKSSWCAFLLTMLYGWEEQEAAQWLPWSGALPEGELECTYGGERILLRRRSGSGAPMGEFSATAVSDGRKLLGMTGENAGELLTGVRRAVFERSVLIRQGRLPVEENSQLTQCMSALISADESENFPEAKARLLRRREALREELQAAEQEERGLNTRLDALWQGKGEEQLLREALFTEREGFLREAAQAHTKDGAQAPDETWSQAEAELETARLRLEEMEEEDTRLEEEAIGEVEEQISLREREIRQRGWSFFAFCLLALVLAIAVMASTLVDLEELRPGMLAAAVCFVGVVVLLVALLRGRLDRRDYREIDELTEELEERYLLLETWDLEWEAALLRERAAERGLELLALRREGLSMAGEWAGQTRLLAQKEAQLALLSERLREMGDPQYMEAALLQLRQRLQQLLREGAALDTALAALEEAEQALCRRLSPALNEQAGRYLAYLSGGAYEALQVEPGFRLLARPAKGESLRAVELLSQGTQDMVYLSLRLALSDLLARGKDACPLILDDALLRLDDTACLLALKLFKHSAEHRQMILLSGQRREEELLSQEPGLARQHFLRKPAAARN